MTEKQQFEIEEAPERFAVWITCTQTSNGKRYALRTLVANDPHPAVHANRVVKAVERLSAAVRMAIARGHTPDPNDPYLQPKGPIGQLDGVHIYVSHDGLTPGEAYTMLLRRGKALETWHQYIAAERAEDRTPRPVVLDSENLRVLREDLAEMATFLGVDNPPSWMRL